MCRQLSCCHWIAPTFVGVGREDACDCGGVPEALEVRLRVLVVLIIITPGEEGFESKPADMPLDNLRNAFAARLPSCTKVPERAGPDDSVSMSGCDSVYVNTQLY